MDGARIKAVVDMGFGDATEPGLENVDLPVLLGMPVPRLRSYARETVVAEKFEAMVRFGRANSRMNDFYDVWLLSRSYTFDGDRLARAIAGTFRRRGTPIPSEVPDGLTRTFADDPLKRKQWDDFIQDVAYEPGTLDGVVETLAEFLMPHAEAARKG